MFDNIWYARTSHQLASGTYQVQEVTFTIRYGILVPTAFFYLLGGVTELTSVLYNLLCSLGMVALTYMIALRMFSTKVGVVAAFIIALFPLNVLHATQLYPDIPLALVTGIGIWLFLRYHLYERKARYLFLSGVCCGIGYLIRQSVFFLLVFFLIYWLVFSRRWGAYWGILSGLLPFLLADMLFFGITKGDPFFRIHLVTSGHHLAAMDAHFPTTESRLYRLFVMPFSILFFPLDKQWPYFCLSYYLFLPALFVLLKGSRLIKVILLWWGVFFACTVWWPLTLVPFRPSSQLYARMMEPLSIPMALIIGYFLIHSIKSRWLSYALLGLWSLACLFSNLLIHEYLTEPLDGHREAFRVLRQKSAKRIYTDQHFPALYQLWSGFDPDLELRFWTDSRLKTEKDAYVVVNEGVINELKRTYNLVLPGWILRPPGHWRKIWEQTRRWRWDPREIGGGKTYKVSIYYVE
jgi:4-amino-4-deoxy-L-arabinose transferase-like glycosyltransferase